MLNRYNRNSGFNPFGMKNNGNTCYFNSLIQSLLSCTAVTDFFLNKRYKFIRDDNKVALEYINLININKSSRGSSIIDPKKLLDSIISAVKIKYPNKNFGNSRQEDSGELFTLFLDIIDDPELYKYFMYKYLVKIWCFDCLKQIAETVDKSCILEVSYNLSGFTIKNKDIKSNKFNTHLYQYMNILNDYTCPKCKNTNCCKIYQLTTSPDILVIMFNKFYRKDIINFPNTIQFPKKNTQSMITESDKKHINYKLVSIINHSGSQNGGHYWANCLRNESVYNLNDSNVSIGSFTPTRESYMLFYHNY